MPDRRDEWERGLLAYREGRFFDAHEHWEELWRALATADDQEQRRRLLQALVQLAAALHKLRSGIRPGGAPALLDKAAEKLARIREPSFGVDPARLLPQVRRLREQARRVLASDASPPYPVDVPEVGDVT
ncbi:MAG: DUF309 domain-containing protein [Polyangiales bacterium]